MKSPRYVIAVPDLHRSATFYRDVLGFEIREIGDAGWRFYVRGGCTIMAGECPDAMPPTELGDHSWFAYIEVDRIDELHDEVTSRGATVISDLTDEPWRMREFGIRTVDGHRIKFGSALVDEASSGASVSDASAGDTSAGGEVADRDRSLDDDAAALGRVLGTIPEFVIVIDRRGIIRYINRVEPGYDRDEVIGMSAKAVVTSDSQDAHEARITALFDTGEEQEYEAQVVIPDGTVQWYRTRMLPLQRDGREPEALLVAMNITELKMARDSVEQLRRLLPMCSWCDSIQNEGGEWESIESYLDREESTSVTHGMCPDCFSREMEGLDELEGGDAESSVG